MKKYILLTLFSLVFLCNCSISHIEKDIKIIDDKGSPVKGVDVFIVSNYNLSYDNAFWPPSIDITFEDINSIREIKKTSDSDGNVKLSANLHRPRSHDLVFIKDGYYYTVAPLKTKSHYITILPKKKFKSTLISEFKSKVILSDNKKSFKGITHSRFLTLHSTDFARRIVHDYKKGTTLLSKYNCDRIYDLGINDHEDGIYIHE